MTHFKFLIFTFLVVAICVGKVANAQSRIIELQVTSDARAAIGAQQEWLEMLQNVGADRVVGKTGDVRAPKIEESNLAGSTIVYISGSIKNNRLLLPGGSFSIRDKAGISALIKRLRDDGAVVALAEKKAFGLTSEQLVEVHTTLSKPLNFSTRGLGVGATVEKISSLIGMEFSFDSAALRGLRENETVAEELNGISAGTAIAAIVRPLGLVLQPRRLQGRSLELRIVDSQSSTENWPIGWPLEVPPVQAEPRMFERLPLEIRDFPLGDTLNAIEQRTGVLFLYDHNAIAREGIEVSEVKVTLVHEDIQYMVAVARLLRQSKPRLIEELRADENGKPFLWISTR